MTLAAYSSAGASSASSNAATDKAAGSSSPAEATAASAAATTTVNANTASIAELQAAFEAAGISNADKWAREVAEYRPYPDDPTWAQLRQELGKDNIDPAVLGQIVALLEV